MYSPTSGRIVSTIIPDSPQHQQSIQQNLWIWRLSEEIVEVLDKQVSRDHLTWGYSVTNWRQNLQEQFSHLISDLQAVCLGTELISDEEIISQIYEVQHSHILQLEASDPASAFPLLMDIEYEGPFERVFKMLFTKYPQYQRLEFTGQHYTTVAEYFMMYYLDPP